MLGTRRLPLVMTDLTEHRYEEHVEEQLNAVIAIEKRDRWLKRSPEMQNSRLSWTGWPRLL
jgi:hypothetical protein